ncbi:T6SS effector amidase Tae4 family protein [Cellvibrio sp. PSBB023]|uniref:T6SS effector amidase Tae4 family protein n=1 Tax=Cellvibrio sp. PSBB023 TaxID=1945512 RepID=UPI00098E9B59|nr:T6SS effector amidase Tae4 family protein [Cellvibrio sp. PSBB023]AQT62082.1 hypothetical protein B0D95_19685 [Cellvibrio sp. PSBB023]
MKPIYQALKKHHHSSEPSNSNYLSGAAIYKEIGYDIDSLLKQNAGYANTCATRMSLALIKAGVNFQGRLRIKSGAYKGRTIETGAKLLADQLMQPGIFGKPEIFTDTSTAPNKIGTKKGVIFFWKITGYDGGHIDLIESNNKVQMCNSHCYFNCKEIWFWELS